MRLFRSILLLLLAAGWSHVARADSFTFDLTGTGRVAFPSWIPGRPVASPRQHAELSFPIKPGPADDDLALTVIFNDDLTGYLAVYWADVDNRRELLSANLFEGIGLPNQRTLLLKRPTIAGTGRIVLQSSAAVLNVVRVKLEWVHPSVVRMSDEVPNGALVLGGYKFFAPEEVDGSALTPIADTWAGKILTTSVSERAERIENGVEYPVQIPSKVIRARVEVVINGLPVNDSLELWLNGAKVGLITPETPDLSDPGYNRAGGSARSFSGWRRGTLLLSGELLPVGDNRFQFALGSSIPVAIRDFLLQVEYAPIDLK